jgi:hypothetical protein
MFIVLATYLLYPFLAKSNQFIRPKTTTRRAHKARKNERKRKTRKVSVYLIQIRFKITWHIGIPKSPKAARTGDNNAVFG